MNRQLFWSIVLAIVLGFIAYSDAATLNISGSIAPSCSMSTITATNNTSVNMSGGTTSVGNFTVSCNIHAGYNIVVTSANSGVLTNAANPNNTAAYSLTLTGAGSQGSSSLSSAFTAAINASLSSPVVATPYTIDVNVTPPTAFSGTYSDTLTLTLNTL